MSKTLYLQISEKSKKVFKSVVETYLNTGEPVGSETLSKTMGIDISSSSIRSILANLQRDGFLFAPHISSGRVPTDKGIRYFVEGLLEFGRLSKSEQQNIKTKCKAKGALFEDVLGEASKTLSGLSKCAGFVVAPKYQNKIKHIEFIKLDSNKIMSIIANENGLVENRILEPNYVYDDSNLRKVSNYLNSKFSGNTFEEIKLKLNKEIKNSKLELDTVSTKLVKEGIIQIPPNKSQNPYLFLHGQSTLLEDDLISKDLDKIRTLFDDIENKSNFLNILESTNNGQGVQIFIGSQNNLFNHSGLSMVMAPYKNNEQKIIGAIGVVGSMRINYARIVPLVDYTSKIVGRILS
ncbi:MAG: Heat-inducible transcription repressor HrcA [Alphaproteobacteria bacterium MarineAlpha5_Bin9]|nr:MAG: Heat-inducible transcription repressor HrcA [Alphaproteobacteria bacterium MarineAlpha5_Bin9]|tara:strand:+ start:9308 stop:10357 length:1050 start_codon:yes stop_codon:yes gene_type:complete